MASEIDGSTCIDDTECYPIPGSVCMNGTCRCPCGYRYINDTNGEKITGERALCVEGISVNECFTDDTTFTANTVGTYEFTWTDLSDNRNY